MLFSIITVCFNSAKTIRQTFESVLQQEFTDYEYIVVDGASTDGTVDIIKEYEPKFQGRMRWISEPDTGIYNAMNKGARMAKGDYLAFINSDDWLEKDPLTQVAQCIEENPGFKIYYGIVRIINWQDREKALLRFSHNTITEQPVNHPATFTSREFFLLLGGFNEKYRIVSDFDFFIRASREGTQVYYPMDIIVTCFRDPGASATAESRLEAAKMLVDQKIISRKTLNLRLLVFYKHRIMQKIWDIL